MTQAAATACPLVAKAVAPEFGRSPRWFMDCIVGGEALEKHRSAMPAVGRPCVFGEDVKLLARPGEVDDVLFHLSSAGVTFEDLHFSWGELRAGRVIVGKALEAGPDRPQGLAGHWEGRRPRT